LWEGKKMSDTEEAKIISIFSKKLESNDEGDKPISLLETMKKKKEAEERKKELSLQSNKSVLKQYKIIKEEEGNKK
jgi:hypothetical protein